MDQERLDWEAADKKSAQWFGHLDVDTKDQTSKIIFFDAYPLPEQSRAAGGLAMDMANNIWSWDAAEQELIYRPNPSPFFSLKDTTFVVGLRSMINGNAELLTQVKGWLTRGLQEGIGSQVNTGYGSLIILNQSVTPEHKFFSIKFTLKGQLIHGRQKFSCLEQPYKLDNRGKLKPVLNADAEVRPVAFKSMLRYWFRVFAMGVLPVSNVQRLEGEVFGAITPQPIHGWIKVRIVEGKVIQPEGQKDLCGEQTGTLQILYSSEIQADQQTAVAKLLKNLTWMMFHLGGVGQGARRPCYSRATRNRAPWWRGSTLMAESDEEFWQLPKSPEDFKNLFQERLQAFDEALCALTGIQINRQKALPIGQVSREHWTEAVDKNCCIVVCAGKEDFAKPYALRVLHSEGLKVKNKKGEMDYDGDLCGQVRGGVRLSPVWIRDFGHYQVVTVFGATQEPRQKYLEDLERSAFAGQYHQVLPLSKSILIANIGTSDLSIKINSYFIPISYEREEPNTVKPPKSSVEADIWGCRTQTIIDFAQEELKIILKPLYPQERGFKSPEFRELTQKILQKCQEDESYFDRLSPGRIWGVIDTALNENFNLTEIYLFVTDQNPADKGDTIFLLEILKGWLNRKYEQSLPKITPVIIDFSAIDQDKLFDFYYNFFGSLNINPKDRILLSIKGGTPQMATAMYAQATASMYNRQVLLQPQLDIVRAMRGEPSDCQLVSYWRYLRSQKYQAVTQLLERWDFVGGKQILKAWAADLQSLADLEITDDKQRLNSSRNAVNLATMALELADYYLNLDHDAIERRLGMPAGKKIVRAIQVESGLTLTSGKNDLQELILNLFAQAKIYWDLNQVANFLSRLGTFYEKSQYLMIEKLGGNAYLTDESKLSSVSREKLQEHIELLNNFRELQGNYWNEDYRKIRISDRPARTNFLKALFLSQNPKKYDINLIKHWQKLDLWFISRNDVIHQGEGISQERLRNFFEAREQFQPEQGQACPPDRIIPTMLAIRNIFVTNQVRHYHVYTVLHDWVNKTLKDDLKPTSSDPELTPTTAE
jgi:CRISPR-associated protein Cmr6